MRGEEKAEIQGRIAFILRKYELDLDSLSKLRGSLRERSGEMYGALEEGFNGLYSRCKYLIAGVSLSGQPYSFDFDTYKVANDIRL